MDRPATSDYLTLIYATLLALMVAIHALAAADRSAIREGIDALCRAHYPECIVGADR